MPGRLLNLFHVKRERIPAPVVSRETIEKLGLFKAELLRWSTTVNLIAPGDLPHLAARHVDDSLQLLPLLAGCDGNVSIDIGSGAGFPGMMLAIATRRLFHLFEVDQRKAAFLRHVARLCEATVDIHAERFEATSLSAIQLATARAVAPLTRLLTWVQPRLRGDGVCLFMKGRTAAVELRAAQELWHMDVRCWESRTDNAATILQISNLVPRG